MRDTQPRRELLLIRTTYLNFFDTVTCLDHLIHLTRFNETACLWWRSSKFASSVADFGKVDKELNGTHHLRPLTHSPRPIHFDFLWINRKPWCATRRAEESAVLIPSRQTVNKSEYIHLIIALATASASLSRSQNKTNYLLPDER